MLIPMLGAGRRRRRIRLADPGILHLSRRAIANSSRQLGEFGLVVLAMMIVMHRRRHRSSVSDPTLRSPISRARCCSISAGLAAVGDHPGRRRALRRSSACSTDSGRLSRLRAFLTTLVTLIIVRALVEIMHSQIRAGDIIGFVDSAAWDYWPTATSPVCPSASW